MTVFNMLYKQGKTVQIKIIGSFVLIQIITSCPCKKSGIYFNMLHNIETVLKWTNECCVIYKCEENAAFYFIFILLIIVLSSVLF